MLQHPDPDLRWDRDVAFFKGPGYSPYCGSARRSAFTLFDQSTLQPSETGSPTPRKCRRPSISWLDGSFE